MVYTSGFVGPQGVGTPSGAGSPDRAWISPDEVAFLPDHKVSLPRGGGFAGRGVDFAGQRLRIAERGGFFAGLRCKGAPWRRFRRTRCESRRTEPGYRRTRWIFCRTTRCRHPVGGRFAGQSLDIAGRGGFFAGPQGVGTPSGAGSPD